MRVESIRGSKFWDASDPFVFEDNVSLSEWAHNQDHLAHHVFFRSSGSSGVQKWIALSKDALRWSAESVIEHLQITAEDVCALALPVHHVGGFGLVARCEFSGARLVEFSGAWSPVSFRDFCDQQKVTLTSLVPTQVSDLVSQNLTAPASLREIIVGGGHFDSSLTERARSLGWPVIPSYGMTETASQIASGDHLPLIEGWDARVVDDLLEVKGEGLLSGIITKKENGFHFDNPKSGGWFRTSDRVELHERNLTFISRADRRIKVLGELVDLDALEEFWAKLTGAEVAVIARPNDRRVHTLHLFYTGSGTTVASKNAELPGPERLESWFHLPSLPRTELGKIDRLQMTRIQLD